MVLSITEILDSGKLEVMPLIYPEIPWSVIDHGDETTYTHDRLGERMEDWPTNYYTGDIIPQYQTALDYLDLQIVTISDHTRLDYSIEVGSISDPTLKASLPKLFLFTDSIVTYLPAGHSDLKKFGINNASGLLVEPEERNLRYFSDYTPLIPYCPNKFYYVHFDETKLESFIEDYAKALLNESYTADRVLEGIKADKEEYENLMASDAPDTSGYATDFATEFMLGKVSLPIDGGVEMSEILTTDKIDFTKVDFDSGSSAPSSSTTTYYFSFMMEHSESTPFSQNGVLSFMDSRQRMFYEHDGWKKMIQGQAIAGHPMISLLKAKLMNGFSSLSTTAIAKKITDGGRVDIYEYNVGIGYFNKYDIEYLDTESYPEVLFVRSKLSTENETKLSEALPTFSKSDYGLVSELFIYNPDGHSIHIATSTDVEVTQDGTNPERYEVKAKVESSAEGYIKIYYDSNQDVLLRRIPVQIFAPVFVPARVHEVHVVDFADSPTALTSKGGGNASTFIYSCHQIASTPIGLFAGNLILYPARAIEDYVRSVDNWDPELDADHETHEYFGRQEDSEAEWEWAHEYYYLEMDEVLEATPNYVKINYWGGKVSYPYGKKNSFLSAITPFYDKAVDLNIYYVWNIEGSVGGFAGKFLLDSQAYVFLESGIEDFSTTQTLIHEVVHAVAKLEVSLENTGYFMHFDEDDNSGILGLGIGMNSFLWGGDWMEQSRHCFLPSNFLDASPSSKADKLTHTQATILHEALTD